MPDKNLITNIAGVMAVIGGIVSSYMSGLPLTDPINWLILGGSLIVGVIGYFSNK
jgi:hypothetical protein